MWLLQPVLIHAAYDVVAVPLMVAKVLALGGSVVANFLLYRHGVGPVGAGPPKARGRGVDADRPGERTTEAARS
jgi:hypothetical protein